MRLLSLKIGLLLIFVCVRLSAQVTVDVKVDSTDILIGEQVHLTTTVSAGSGQKVEFPAYASGVLTKGVEVLERGDVDTVFLNAGKRVQLRRSYTLTAFDSALYYLPPVEVLVDGKKYRSQNSIGLKVGTVPVDTVHLNNFSGPHSVVEGIFEWNGYLLGWSVLLWVNLILLFFLLIRYSDRKPVTRRIVIQPKTPPHQQAITEIEKMKSDTPSTEETMKQRYMQLTDILRTYIQERFGFNAREMTSSEIIGELLENSDPSALRELRTLLETADLVKFAKFTTSLNEMDRSLMQAIDFVRTTKEEGPENSKPVVKEVVLDDLKQKRLRIAMSIIVFLLSLSLAVGGGLVIKEIYEVFL